MAVQAVRNEYADLFFFSGMSFVEALRTFLGSFRMPGESMLIERLMTAFARRFYEQNPDFVAHLTDEKVSELKAAFKAAAPDGKAQVDKLTDLVHSLGGDYKWLKEAEVEEMAHITPAELAHVATRLGRAVEPSNAEGDARAVEALQAAAAVGHAEHAASMAAKKAAGAPADEPDKRALLLTSLGQAQRGVQRARKAREALGERAGLTLDFILFAVRSAPPSRPAPPLLRPAPPLPAPRRPFPPLPAPRRPAPPTKRD